MPHQDNIYSYMIKLVDVKVTVSKGVIFMIHVYIITDEFINILRSNQSKFIEGNIMLRSS
jgi:hypothetical protein